MRVDQTPIVEIWVYLSGSPLFALTLTLAAYSVGVYGYERSGKHPLANPVLVALLIVTGTLVVTDIPYRTYFEGAQFVHFLLGTGTVALAIPIYAGWQSLRGRFGVLVLAVAAGGITSMVTGVLVLRLLEADPSFSLAMYAKSVTAPIGMGIAERIQASPTLTAVFAVTTGILGAVFG
ncbi:MAG: LrgB family protein, partial [Betaproteobacteria bacterium]|nr:LrgB family protein [Betaproteobacteria bacterium]